MRVERGVLPIDLARELVEDALAIAARRADPALEESFREEKDAIESIETVDIREECLAALDAHWMERFRITQALESVLVIHPGVGEALSECVVKAALGRGEERAFLYAPSSRPKPVLVVHITAETLLEPEKLQKLVKSPLARAARDEPL